MTDIRQLVANRYGREVDAGGADTDTIRTLLGHRSCRRYANEPIAEAVLRLLLACAQSAPSKSNLQQYSIVVLTDAARRRRLADLVPSMPWISEAPVVLVFLGDIRRIRRLAEMRSHAYENDNADTFMNAAVDAALAMQALVVAAESLGLGTCLVSHIRNRIDDLVEILDLPDGVFPIAGMALGRPAGEGRMSVRLPQEVVVHRERYDDEGLSAEVAAYDERAHAHQPLGPAKQRHTDKYGVLEKCTWSENVARQLSIPERADFADFLKRRGITLD